MYEVFFKENRINTDTYTCMITHSYKYIHTYLIPMNISERLSRLERLTVDEDVVSH
jgi:hypothetical protein